MSDDRDQLKKHPIPEHIAAQIGGVPVALVVDDVTRPNATLPEKLDSRSKRAVVAAESTQAQVTELKEELEILRVQHAEHRGFLKFLTESAVAANAERERRMVLDQQRDDKERAERADKRKLIVPIITAIGIAIAGAITALAATGALR